VEKIEPFYKWNLITGDADDNKFVDVAEDFLEVLSATFS
jgi:hypothetical protein